MLICFIFPWSLYFEWNFHITVLCFSIGMILMAFSGYATHSATLDLRAFTTDPLGWRKIKKSEGASAEQEKSEKSGDNRIDPS